MVVRFRGFEDVCLNGSKALVVLVAAKLMFAYTSFLLVIKVKHNKDYLNDINNEVIISYKTNIKKSNGQCFIN